ncbi:hypothetical protein ACT691_19045 [Vibrio metschnikovii]
MPIIHRLPAMQRGQYLAITDPTLIMASSYGSLLSLEWTIPKLVPKLQQALSSQKYCLYKKHCPHKPPRHKT